MLICEPAPTSPVCDAVGDDRDTKPRDPDTWSEGAYKLNDYYQLDDSLGTL